MILSPEHAQEFAHRHDAAECPEADPHQQKGADSEGGAELERFLASQGRLTRHKRDQTTEQHRQGEQLTGSPAAKPNQQKTRPDKTSCPARPEPQIKIVWLAEHDAAC